jgi:hypothetical protein
MNCWRVQNLVVPFLEEELPEAEADAIGDHVAACSTCEELFEAVGSLPPLPKLELEAEVESALFEQFDSQLATRLAQSFATPQATEDLDGPRLALASMLRARVRVPAALVGAYFGVVLLLAGGIALNHYRVQGLELAVQERDVIIDAMSSRLATQSGDVALAESQVDPAVVFMPAGVTSSSGLSPVPMMGLQPASFQTGSTAGPTPASYRRVSGDGLPRVVH